MWMEQKLSLAIQYLLYPMTESDIDVVSISASGDLHREVDIQKLAADVSLPISNYNPEQNAAFFRFEDGGELLILYVSGKYILRGGNDFDEMYKVNDEFLKVLSGHGLPAEDATLAVKNVVAMGDLEQKINLNTLAVGLGLEETEYEPEQFPGLIFRPSESRCVLLVFSSAKVVITGGRTKEEDKIAFKLLSDRVDNLSIGE